MKKLLFLLLVSLILSGFDGKAQTALEFDGVDDYVQTDYPGIFEDMPRTFMAWINLSAAPTVDMCILDFGSANDGARNTFMVNEDGYPQFDMGGDMLIGTFGGTLPVGEWIHVAFVYDGGEGFLYINGGKVDNGNLDLFTPEDEEPLRIGESILGGMPFKGMIDEVSVWDVAVAEEDITSYSCIDGSSIPAEVAAYYDFNDGTGTTLTELVNGWDGTLENMTEDDWVASTVCGTSYNVTFVVTKDDNVTPIENAEVDLDGAVQFTDASGETIFESFPGNYNYTVSKAGYLDESSTVDVVDADVTVYESLTLSGENYDVTFTVTDGANPIENALVDLDGVQQYTDASGETTFTDFLPETYSYYITKEGYFPVFGDVEVVDANVTVIESLLVEQSTALEFDGTGYYVQTIYSGVTGSGSRTFMAWIYRQAGLTANKCIMDYGRNVAYSRNTFMVNGSGYLVYLSGGSGSGLTADVASVPEEEWVHVAFVYDGSDAFLYQNGVQVGTKTFISGVNTQSGYTDLMIGKRVGGDLNWKGMMDEVSVWDVALTQQEVQDYACIGNPYSYVNLDAYYTFNEGTGTTLTDLVGGNNGTLIGMDETDWVTSDVCVTTYTQTVWTGDIDNNWHDAANWSDGIPDATTNATIPAGLSNYPTIAAAADCNDITIESNATGYATLLDGGFLTVNGTANVESHLTGNVWHFVGSPVAGATAFDVFHMGGAGYDVYLQSFDETTNTYTDVVDAPLNVMEGYAAWVDGGDYTFTYSGALNTGSFGAADNMTRTIDNDDGGNNLLSNPYSSGLDWDIVKTTNVNMMDAYYVEDNGGWATYVGGAGVGTAGVIAPGQGFFAFVSGGAAPSTGTVIIDNSARVHTGTAFLKDGVANLVRLEALGNNKTDETVVRFLEEATPMFDEQYDAFKLFAYDEEIPQIYSVSNKDMAINSLPETNQVQLGFVAFVDGEYTISATEVNEIAEVWLEDTFLDVNTNLLTDSYTFNYTTGENADRFILHFSPMAVSDNVAELISIHSFNNNVFVNLPNDLEGQMTVYNAMGQEILTSPLNEAQNVVALEESGFYIVKVNVEGQQVSKKVFVK